MEEDMRQRAKARLLRVTMPDGEVICYNRSSQTFIEALQKIGSENFPKIDLKVAGVPFFSKEIYPKFKDDMKEVCDGWYVVMAGGTSGRYLQLRSIAQKLGINMEVEIGDGFITKKKEIDLSGRKRDTKLLVKFPDGTFAAGENPIDSFLEAIWKIGVDKIARKELEFRGKPIITYSKMYNGQVQVDKDKWLTVPGQTKDKYKLLRFLDMMMRLGLEVNLI
jgi:hypothetical protein